MNPRKKRHDESLPDEELLHRYQTSGDKVWLGYLLDRYSLLLYGLSMKYLSQEQSAEDAVSQVFLKLLSDMDLSKVQDFRPWIMVVMKNHCLQLIRNRKGKLEPLPETELEVLVGTSLPKESMDKEEDVQGPNGEEMLGLMEGLPEAQRLCLRLFYLEKCSYMEIVRRTGYELKAVKSAIQNGKRNLRIRWQKTRGEES